MTPPAARVTEIVERGRTVIHQERVALEHVEQRLDAREQFLCDDRCRRSRIRGAARHLVREAHGVHRHDDRVGPQNAVVADHELRAVLQVQEHAVAALHCALALEESGEPLDLAEKIREAQLRVVKNQKWLCRVTLSRRFGVANQGNGGDIETRRRVRREEAKVPVGHGALYSVRVRGSPCASRAR